MLKPLFGAALLSVLLFACGDPDVRQAGKGRAGQTPPPAKPAAALEFCGGEAGPGEIDAYFTRLAAHLATSADPVPMEFYGESFGVHSSDRSLRYRRSDMRAGARALPSVEDWREISRQGHAELQGAGWRGCFLAHGKVWFEADGRGGFAMTSFDKAMPWDASTS